MTENPDACSNDRDCSAGAKCSRHVCFDPREPSVPLLLEVVPPSGTERIAGISFTELLAYGVDSTPTPYLSLGFVSVIEGQLTFASIRADSCVPRQQAGDGSATDPAVLARVTMAPRKRLLGFPDAARVVDIPLSSTPLSWNVAPGEYDIYVEPGNYEGSCARPPMFFEGVSVGPGQVSLPITLGNPEVLDVTVRYPEASGALQGFSIAVVEPSSGRLVSSVATLGQPLTLDGKDEYQVQLALAPMDPSVRGASLLRLSPAPSRVAPTVYVPLAVAELLEPHGALVDQLSNIPEPVHFSGRVVREGSLTGEQALVTFRADTLDSLADGALVTLIREVEVDKNGAFDVDLLPGEYDAEVEVLDPQLARTTARFVVEPSDEPEVGKTIEVSQRRRIVGRLLTPLGHPISGALVDANPPTAGTASAGYASWLDRGKSRPSALPTISDSRGGFEFLSDPGMFDVVARPAVSGLAWLIRQGSSVGDGKVEMGDLKSEPPLRVVGSVSSDELGRSVPFALVRAYAYIGPDGAVSGPDTAEYVLPVGESRADEDGRFYLYLPAMLATPDVSKE